MFMDNSEAWIQENMPLHDSLFEYYGFCNRVTGKNSIVSNDGSTYIRLDNGQLVYQSSETEIEKKAENIEKFAGFCQENNAQFLYVNFPSKPASDSELIEIGYPSYANQNADALLHNLEEKKIEYLDLRESIKSHNMDFYSLFYKTDHHWNADAGIFATQEIVSKINKDFRLDLDTVCLENDNFSKQVYTNCWLGETGRVMTKTYSGLDDFIVIKPLYDTSLRYDADESDLHKEGDFSILLNEEMYTNNNNKIYNTSWHYSYLYSNFGEATITNNLKDEPKVLLIKDSFALVVAPYLALTTGQVTLWDMRYNNNDVEQYILENDFDLVIVAYTQTSLRKSNMFDFDKRID